MTKKVLGYLSQGVSLLLESGKKWHSGKQVRWQNSLKGCGSGRVTNLQGLWGEDIYTFIQQTFLKLPHHARLRAGHKPHNVSHCSYSERALGLRGDRHENKQLHRKLWCKESHAIMEVFTKRNVVKGDSDYLWRPGLAWEMNRRCSNLTTWAKAKRQEST